MNARFPPLSSNQNRVRHENAKSMLLRVFFATLRQSALRMQKLRHRMVWLSTARAFRFRSSQSRCRPSFSQDRHAAVVSFQTASTTTCLFTSLFAKVMDANIIATGTKLWMPTHPQRSKNSYRLQAINHNKQASKDCTSTIGRTQTFPSLLTHTLELNLEPQKCRSKIPLLL